jgi:hypothetical protein
MGSAFAFFYCAFGTSARSFNEKIAYKHLNPICGIFMTGAFPTINAQSDDGMIGSGTLYSDGGARQRHVQQPDGQRRRLGR